MQYDSLTEAQMKGSKAIGEMLVEKWAGIDASTMRGYGKEGKLNFLEGINDPQKKVLLSMLFENQKKIYDRLDEMTRTVNIGSFEKFVFPLIRAVYANIITAELFSVQPLDVPNGLIFYLDVIYGSTKGKFQKGQKMSDALAGPMTNAITYTSEKVEGETLGTGNGGVANYTGNLSWTPIRPGTIQITDGTQTVTDDGNGNLIGDIGAGNNTIDYITGAYDVTFAANVGAGEVITADYTYNIEESLLIPEIEIVLTSSPVMARKRALKAVWSLDAEMDMKNFYGINSEVEIIAYQANEIQKEIYNDMIYKARSIAPGGYVTWDSAIPIGVSETEHRLSFVNRVTEGSNIIFKNTQRFGANWLVCGVEMASVIETLPETYFKRAGVQKGAGVHYIGDLNTGQKVFKDPAYPSKEGLLGYKGSSFLDAGIVQAVYLGIYTTDTIRLDDFRVRKAMATRMDIKVVNARYYQKIRIV